jgi:predicted nucleic acid-binding protein
LTLFVDSSVWFATLVARDAGHGRAKAIMREASLRVITDYVLVETWLLLNSRYRREAGERFWADVRRGAARVEFVSPADMERAWAIGEAFQDQNFSIVDRTSFAVMERLGIRRVASFDDDFAVYRYGRGRDKAFEVIR